MSARKIAEYAKIEKMSETNKMQKLHQLAVKGEVLTAEENAVLQNWYETLDREEDSILNDSQPVRNDEDLRRQLTNATKQATAISREIETLILQNENLRNENKALKNTLESRLLEKVA